MPEPESNRAHTHPESAKRCIAIVYNSAWYLYHFRRPLIQTLQARGYVVHAITPWDDAVPKLQELGVIHQLLTMSAHGLNPLQELKTLNSLYRALKELKPELVISYTIKCNIYTGLIRRLLGFKQIVNIVGLGRAFERKNALSSLARSLYRWSIYHADQTFFQNEEDRESFTAQGIVNRERTTVTPGSGVDLSIFSESSKVSLGNKRIFFLFGRLIPAKGFMHFVEAITELKKTYPNQIEGWIAGGLDGLQPESLKLKEKLEHATSLGHIRYLGHSDAIADLISQASVVVLPSTYNEGVPRSLLEALACGKPIITTDWKGCRETVISGENGLLVKPNDTESLKSALETFTVMSASELERYGNASRLYAERRFDQKIVLTLYLNAIEGLLNRAAE